MDFYAEATFVNGVMRWKSNGRVPPDEYVKQAFFEGFPVHFNKCDEARTAETREFLAAYRKARADGPTDEERMEARAELGAGVELVDVITGHKWRT